MLLKIKLRKSPNQPLYRIKISINKQLETVMYSLAVNPVVIANYQRTFMGWPLNLACNLGSNTVICGGHSLYMNFGHAFLCPIHINMLHVVNALAIYNVFTAYRPWVRLKNMNNVGRRVFITELRKKCMCRWSYYSAN